MVHAAHPRSNIAVLLVVLALSALTMIWLFWHHPVKTAIGTVALLTALGISARLARLIETDAGAEFEDSTRG